MRILVVDDEPAAAAVLAKGLREHAYAVDVAADGSSALERASINDYDLIVLDVLMPGINGLEVCRRFRAEGIAAPVLMLTARGEPDQRVEGLDVGADDYLAKPYHFPELLARIRALLRRGPALASSVLQIEDLTVDTRTRRVQRAGRVVQLTSKEYALLEYPGAAPGRRRRPRGHRRARLGRQLRPDVQPDRGVRPAAAPEDRRRPRGEAAADASWRRILASGDRR